MTVNQCTVDQNTCTSTASGVQGSGGGIGSQFGTLTVEFSTVSRSTVTGGGGIGGDALGGAIWSANGNTTNVNSSTLGKNGLITSGGGLAHGGALWMDNSCAVSVNNSTIWNNASGVWITHGSAFHPYDSIISGSDPGGFDIDGT